MLKLPLLLLVLLGASAAQVPHSLAQLQSNARILIVFAPTSNSASFQKQMELIERHSFELSLHNTVVVPVSTRPVNDGFSFENLPLGTAIEQADARSRFHVGPNEFRVILVDRNGTEQVRSAAPLDIHSLMASLDSSPAR
jgi:hypothetical protein